MSSSEVPLAAAASTTNDALPRAELDITKLHALPSEQQDLYLLTFTSELVQHVSGLEAAQVSSQQKFLKKELFKVLTLSSPTITRVIRNNLGRCFGTILGKGDRGILFETVTEFLGVLNAGKSEELKTKFAAAHCLGEVYAVVGESAFAQSGTVILSLLKLLKPSANHTGLRGSIFAVIRKVVVGAGVPIDEPIARDVWKQTRNAATSDKSTFVQLHACRCIEQLLRVTPYFDNSNDFDNLKSVIWKVIDSPVAPVRHAAATCLARVLVKLHAADNRILPAPKSKKSKRQSKKPAPKPGEEEDEAEFSEPSTPKKETRLFFLLPDLLRQLSAQYMRNTTSNRARVGIAVCYKHVLRNLGDRFIEERYGQFATHFVFELLNHATVTYNRFRLLMTRKFVKSILEDTVGRESLRENSQLNAAKWLINEVLKDYPQVIQERREPSKYSLTSTLSALSSLITTLGSAFGELAESCREALIQVLPHPSYTVQVHTAHCLRTFVLACPHQLLSCVTICLNSLSREIGQLSTPRQAPRRCVAYANGLSAMLSTSRLQPLYGSVDVFARVFSQATDLLKTSSSSELRAASTQIQVAWILIGGLMPLGPSFVKIHLSQLMLLWKNALPKHGKENFAQRGNLEISFLTHVRECALSSLLVFIEFNAKLITADGAKRIATMLQNTVAFLDDLPRQKSAADLSQRLHPSLQLHDFATMTRRRVLQCFSKLIHVNHLNPGDIISQSSLLGLAISSFADPDWTQSSPLESSIAASTGQFETLWDLCDNFGFGVTGLVREYIGVTLSGKHSNDNGPAWSAVESEDQAINDAVSGLIPSSTSSRSNLCS